MRKLLLLMVVVLPLIWAFPDSGNAACIQNDLAGTWFVYLSGAKEQSDPNLPNAWWNWFKITVDASGQANGSQITHDGEGTPVKSTAGLIGQLTLRSNCVVKGGISIAPDDLVLETIYFDHGHLSINKEVVNGVAHRSSKFAPAGTKPTIATFTMSKK